MKGAVLAMSKCLPDGEDHGGVGVAGRSCSRNGETAVQERIRGSFVTCQQKKSVTNYLCLSLKGEFLNNLGRF